MGLLLKVVVHVANLQDREGVKLLLAPVKGLFPRMEKVWVDQAYSGTGKTWIEQQMEWSVEVVERSPRRGWTMTEDQGLVWVSLPKTFERLPRRWVVENTQPQYP
jgi:putative transposase